MKRKINELVSNLWDRIDYAVRLLCYGLSPALRLTTIVLFCAAFGIMSIYMTVSSIYNIGKQEAKKAFLEVEHIQLLELEHLGDSINYLKNNQKYE